MLRQWESACKPASVATGLAGGGGHPSGAGVAAGLVRSTRGLGRASLRAVHGEPWAAVRPLLDLAPGGVCRADRSPGRWCALTAPLHPYRTPGVRRSVLCGTFLRVAPTGR